MSNKDKKMMSLACKIDVCLVRASIAQSQGKVVERENWEKRAMSYAQKNDEILCK